MKQSHRGLIKLLFRFCSSFGLVAAMFAQRPFHQYPSIEYGESAPLPPDWQRPGEWAFARLMYPPGPNDGYRGRFDGDWRQGMSLWTQDGPPADRAFSAAVRRLTRIDARSVEMATRSTIGRGFTPCMWANGESPNTRQMSCVTICCGADS